MSSSSDAVRSFQFTDGTYHHFYPVQIHDGRSKNPQFHLMFNDEPKPAISFSEVASTNPNSQFELINRWTAERLVDGLKREGGGGDENGGDEFATKHNFSNISNLPSEIERTSFGHIIMGTDRFMKGLLKKDYESKKVSSNSPPKSPPKSDENILHRPSDYADYSDYVDYAEDADYYPDFADYAADDDNYADESDLEPPSLSRSDDSIRESQSESRSESPSDDSIRDSLDFLRKNAEKTPSNAVSSIISRFNDGSLSNSDISHSPLSNSLLSLSNHSPSVPNESLSQFLPSRFDHSISKSNNSSNSPSNDPLLFHSDISHSPPSNSLLLPSNHSPSVPNESLSQFLPSRRFDHSIPKSNVSSNSPSNDPLLFHSDILSLPSKSPNPLSKSEFLPPRPQSGYTPPRSLTDSLYALPDYFSRPPPPPLASETSSSSLSPNAIQPPLVKSESAWKIFETPDGHLHEFFDETFPSK